MITYLYVKTHTKTGLKYLGITRRSDPHKYRGSGIRWLNHLRKHGFTYTTQIIMECDDQATLQKWATYYSDLWNVSTSDEWANLMPELGISQPPFQRSPASISKQVATITGRKHSTERRAKQSASMQGKNTGPKPWVSERCKGTPLSADHKKNISKIKKGKPGRRHTDAERQKISDSKTGVSIWTEEQRAEMSLKRTGVPKSDEHRKNMTIAALNRAPQKTLTCEHCGLVANTGNFTRWHGDKCKSRLP